MGLFSCVCFVSCVCFDLCVVLICGFVFVSVLYRVFVFVCLF